MVLLSVVVPTFNEAENIRPFLAQLEAPLQGRDYEIVVVDDNSPDGTHRIVAEYAAKHPRVRLVLREHEKGLATAVIEGMRRSDGDFVVVMDSDGQHPAETVPQLLDAAIGQDADCVVASRYAKGGSVTGFPVSRKVISWGARMLAIWGLPVVRRFKVRDPMSGFFLVRRAQVPLERLRPLGYKILVEVLARSDLRRVAEVGYAFKVRTAGESKLKIKTQVDYFRHVVRLGVEDRQNRRLVKFGIVGATGVAVHLSIQYFLSDHWGWRWLFPFLFMEREYHWGTFAAGAAARELALLWNFVWNDRFTFRHETPHADAGYLQRMFRFHIVSFTSFLGYLLVFGILAALSMHYLAASAIAIFAAFFLNYSGNVRWTYARRATPPLDVEPKEQEPPHAR